MSLPPVSNLLPLLHHTFQAGSVPWPCIMQTCGLFPILIAVVLHPNRPDHIHYQILKHLPETSLQCHLKEFNNIWETGEFPLSWREATITRIAKPGKDPKDLTNYSPIALSSCVCKTMERMINDHLVWFL